MGEGSAELSAKVAELTGTVDEKERRLRELESVVAAQEADHGHTVNRLLELEEANGSLQAELDSSFGELEAMEDKIQHLERLVEDLEKKLTKESGANDELSAENSELSHRQTVLDREIEKAEIQLELIKSVVLREKAF